MPTVPMLTRWKHTEDAFIPTSEQHEVAKKPAKLQRMVEICEDFEPIEISGEVNSKSTAARKRIALDRMVDDIETTQVPIDKENFVVFIKLEMWAMQMHAIECTDEVMATIEEYWLDDNIDQQPLSAGHIEQLVDEGVLSSKQLRVGGKKRPRDIMGGEA